MSDESEEGRREEIGKRRKEEEKREKMEEKKRRREKREEKERKEGGEESLSGKSMIISATHLFIDHTLFLPVSQIFLSFSFSKHYLEMIRPFLSKYFVKY